MDTMLVIKLDLKKLALWWTRTRTQLEHLCKEIRLNLTQFETALKDSDFKVIGLEPNRTDHSNDGKVEAPLHIKKVLSLVTRSNFH